MTTVNEPGPTKSVRGAILCLVAPLRRLAGEPKMDVRLKKTVSWIAGTTSFSKPTAQDRDAHWRVMQVGSWPCNMNLIGGRQARGEVPSTSL
jgi:hypothetical protein